ITVIRETPNGGMVTTEGGDTQVITPTGTDLAKFSVKNTSRAKNLSYWYIITDADDNILDWVNSNGEEVTDLDLSGVPDGECHIWGWSYRGLSDPIVGENISTLDDNAQETISDNWITVIRETPDGGMVSTVDDKNEVITTAGSDGLKFSVKNTSTAKNLSYWYIITDADDNILDWVNSNGEEVTDLDLSGAPAGECHIWGWSYRGLSDPIVGENISTLDDNAQETISDNWITVTRTVVSNITDVQETSVSVYPNPVSNQLVVTSDIAIESVTIQSLSGSVLVKTNESTIQVENLVSGIYVVSIVHVDGTITTTRFVKQ
ncbi:MAG: T9SS type A sorting domain-containing protein, partial [Cytophagales bacterium]|nr:T9SS type A sorting domain-containing protein [Cytophagales bacterium]